MLTGTETRARESGGRGAGRALNTSGPLTIGSRSPRRNPHERLLRAVEDATKLKPAIERSSRVFARLHAVVMPRGAVAVLPPAFGLGTWSEWIGRALIFLVISCPRAGAQHSATFCGAGDHLEKTGLFKGADALERLPRVKAVVLDKTGTLTRASLSAARGARRSCAGGAACAGLRRGAEHLHPIASAVARADARG
jgi:Cd2+/Zn2+-exporting ATPase